MLLTLLFAILAACKCGTFSHLPSFNTIISVNYDDGDDSLCDVKVPCKTLEKTNELLQHFRNDVIIEITSNATLHEVFKIMNASNIHIVGKGNESMISISCNSSNAAFLLYDVYNATMSNLSVVNCTAESTDVYAHRFAVLVQGSYNFTMSNVHFRHCTTTALVLSNNEGEVRVSGCSFTNNSLYSHNVYKYPKTSYPAALSIEQNVQDSETTVHYTVVDSTFNRNRSPRSKKIYDYDTVDASTSLRGCGYGGGIFIEIGENTREISVLVQSTNFSYNDAERGGAVYVYFRQNASKNVVEIVKSRFYRNNAHTCGGGMSLGLFNYSSKSQNIISIRECFFIENTALVAAGLRIFSTYGMEKPSNSKSVVITNSTWLKNRAILSSSVDVIPINRGFENEGYLPVPEFTNCTFAENTNNNQPARHKRFYFTDSGVFTVTKFKVLFTGKTTFTSNKYTALLLLSSTAEFSPGSEVLFMKNTGYFGGAIAMYGFSMIIFNPHSYFNISKNHAIMNGGGIFYQPTDRHIFVKGSVQCFLRSRYSHLSLINTIRVVFEENTAEVGGSSLYTESFYSCYFRCYSIFKHVKRIKFSGDGFVQCVGNFSFDRGSHKHPALTTSAHEFLFPKDNKRSLLSFNVIPGDKLDLNFYVTDSFNKTIHPLMSIRKIDTNARIEVGNPYSLSSIVYPLGKANSSSKFTLMALSANQIAFDFNMTILPCPPGYHNRRDKCVCGAGEKGYASIIQCDDEIFSARYKNDLWVGYIPENSSHHTDLYFAPCFGPVCNETNHALTKYRQNLTGLVCSFQRKGIMCGECTSNYSTYYHSQDFTCGPNDICRLGALFYILSEIIPMVVFFVIVITFDISFTRGMLAGFIFFTQCINELIVHTSDLFSYLRIPYRIFYGLFNFEFFNIERLSFCLWEGAQIQDVLAVRYITIVIAFVLVLIFIMAMRNNQCGRLCNLCKQVSAKSSVVHGLSSFLVICYAQCTKTSFYILKYSRPIGYGGIYEDYYTYYGGLPYFHKQHLIYAVPALLSMVFVTILPPLILLFYPLSLHLLSICGLSEHWMVNKILKLTGITKLTPFIDSFQSCYKDKLRFFAGLYFVYRVAFLLTFSFSSTSFGFILSSGILLTVILGLHSAFHPYKKRIHNLVDSLLFFNLMLINMSSILIKNAISKEIDSKNDFFIVAISTIQLILLYLPMLIVILTIGRTCFVFFRARRDEANLVPVEDILDHIIEDQDRGTNNSRPSYGSMRETHQSSNDTY